MKEFLSIYLLATLAIIATADNCSNKPDGMQIPHENDCGKFVVCFNKKSNEKHCPTGLHFDPKKLYCKKASEAGCDECAGHPDGTQLPHKNDCEKFYVCFNNVKREKNCPADLHFDPKKLYCRYPEEAECDNRCLNQPDGHLFAHKDCEKFYFCYESFTSIRNCAPGLHFDANSLYCKKPDKAGCIDKKPIQPTGTCKGQPDGKRIPYPKDCTRYIVCTQNEIVQSCPPGLHFNENTENCDYPRDAFCKWA